MTLDTKEECLKDLKENYTNPKSSISFSGLSKIYDHYKGVLKLSEIEDFLSSIFSYGYHREPKRLKLKNPIYLYFRRQQLQCDLIDSSNVSDQNNDLKYILTIIDSFTKKAWARMLHDKKAVTVRDAFASVINEAGAPEQLCCDQGREFHNRLFDEYCDQQHINKFVPRTTTHAGKSNERKHKITYYFSTRKR